MCENFRNFPAAALGISARQVERMLSDLKAKGIIRRVGANRNGSWEVLGLGDIL